MKRATSKAKPVVDFFLSLVASSSEMILQNENDGHIAYANVAISLRRVLLETGS